MYKPKIHILSQDMVTVCTGYITLSKALPVCTDEEEVAYLQDITKEDLIKFFKARIISIDIHCGVIR